MMSTYLLILAVLLYLSFDKIIDTFISSNTSAILVSIKTKVFFHTFVAPVIFSLLTFFVITKFNRISSILVGCLLIVGIIIRILSTSRKYLTSFHIDNNNLTVAYLTPFLTLNTTNYNFNDITDFEMTKANWITSYPAAVNFRHKQQWIKFEIIDKKLKKKVAKILLLNK